MKKQINFHKNKKAVSLMISYVLLIVIGMSLAIIVYELWLKPYIIIEPTPTCPETLSLIIQEYSCNAGTKTITIEVKNKGLFNISGYEIRGTNDKTKASVFPLTDFSDFEEGRYFFELFGKGPLKSGDSDEHTFSYGVVGISKDITPEKHLEKIEIVPFKIYKEDIVYCDNSAITQEVECALPTSPPSLCGNRNIDEGEVCDGSSLGGKTCITQGYSSGNLACSSDCQSFDTSNCRRVWR